MLRKVRNILLAIMLIAVAGVVVVLNKTGVGIKDIFANEKIYSTRPYALKIKDRKAVYTTTSAVDYYMTIHDGESDAELTEIVSFDMRAGVNLNNNVKITDDVCNLPYPELIVDQNDFEAPLILHSKGELSWNDQIQPVKTALQKMAESYGRDEVLRKSVEDIEDYFSARDESKKYIVDTSGSVKKHVIDIPYLPIRIDCYTDLLKGSYSFDAPDSLYRRNSLVVSDRGNTRKLFMLSYCQPMNYSYQETNSFMKKYFYDWGYLRVVDPMNPKQKVMYVGLDETNNIRAFIAIDGYLYIAETWPQEDVSPISYLPDMLYLLSCIELKPDYYEGSGYLAWADYYDDCLKQINKKQYEAAEVTLTKMNDLQNGNKSIDEQYLSSLVSILRGKKAGTSTSNESFDVLASAYQDLVNHSMSRYKDSQENRQSLLSSIKAVGDFKYRSLSSELMSYFINECDCDDEEESHYRSQMVETGDVVDARIIKDMDEKEYLDYMYSMLLNTIRYNWDDDTDFDTLVSYFPKSSLENDGQHIMLVKDLRSVGKKDVTDLSYGKTDDIIINHLREKGLSSTSGPLFILLETENRRKVGGVDRDALIFSRDELAHIPNYDGILGEKYIRSYPYEDIRVNKTAKTFSLNDSKYEAASYDPIVKDFITRMHDAYSKKSVAAQLEESLKPKMGQLLIEVVNDYLNSVPYDRYPLTIDLSK